MKQLFLVVILCVCSAVTVCAKIKLPHLFSDNMIVQRDKPIHIWGWADPGERVEVAFKEQQVVTKADRHGNWTALLNPSPYGGPYTLSIRSKTDQKILQQVLVGDVWICSGQSNMEFQTKHVDDAATEIEQAHYPNIRLFTVGRALQNQPQTDVEGMWQICSPATVADFSAVGYFFGRDIFTNTDIPIGLISASWGGTVAETWSSRESLQKFPGYKAKADEVAKIDFEAFQQKNSALKKDFDQALLNDRGQSERWFLGTTVFDHSMEIPGSWDGNELAEFDGVVWFSFEFDLPQDVDGNPAILSLGKIDDADRTWINGIEVGQTQGYAADRRYSVGKDVLRPGKNKIVVRVTDYSGNGGINGPADQLFIQVDRSTYSLAGSWTYKIAVDSRNYSYVDIGPNSYPTLLYNGMIAPLTKFPMKGVIWYQGESNDYDPYGYRQLFSNLILDWRNQWNDVFPFYWVQLANFRQAAPLPQDSRWAEVREAQTMALSLPFTGQALAIDIGDADDIHPRNKQEVGRRLALQALKNDYGKAVVANGPTFKRLTEHNGTLIVEFDSVNANLVVRNRYGYVNGFAVAGADKKFVWAKAFIKGNTVVVYSDDIPEPKFVRYAWSDNPGDSNLYNTAGLPAVPFRFPE